MKSRSLVLAILAVVPILVSCAYLHTPIGPVTTWPTFDSRYDKYRIAFSIPLWPREKHPRRFTPRLARDFPTAAQELCYQPYDIAPDGVPEFDVWIGISKLPDQKDMDAGALFDSLAGVLKAHSEVVKATLDGRPCIHVRHFTTDGEARMKREFYRLPLGGDRFLEVVAQYNHPTPTPEWVRSRRAVFENIVRGIRIAELPDGAE